jgi:TonB family protein
MLIFYPSAFLLLALAQAATVPQSPAAASPSPPVAAPAAAGNVDTPNDPKQRIELGRNVNGLHGLNLGPWHLKASYEVFAPDGTVDDKGTFEEWWIRAKQYKMTFHSLKLSLEEYGTPHGTFRTGGQDWPSKPVGMLPTLLMKPIEGETGSKERKLKNYDRTLGTLRLQCTAFVSPAETDFEQNSYSYCFAKSNAILLYSTNPQRVFQTIFEQVSLVQGHYLGREIEVFLVGKRWLSVHIERLDALGPSAVPDMSVPADALPVSRREDVAGVVTGGAALRKAAPQYPPIAKQQHVQGLVVIGATVGIDGHIKNLKILGGPPLLQKAALDAARQWVYEPFLQDGEPVEAEIELDVEFHLG